MTESAPKWSRRKEARPAEIIEAALDLFIEAGFADTKLSDVAKRAGIAKGTVYRYFDTKEDLFRAVVRQALAANLGAIEALAAGHEGPLADLLPLMMGMAAQRLGGSRLPAILRMVVADSRAFPDLAAIWHDEVVSKFLSLLTRLIAAAQERGEVKAGDPKLHAFSVIGPMVTALLFRELFDRGSPHTPDLQALAAQHARTVLDGLLTRR